MTDIDFKEDFQERLRSKVIETDDGSRDLETLLIQITDDVHRSPGHGHSRQAYQDLSCNIYELVADVIQDYVIEHGGIFRKEVNEWFVEFAKSTKSEGIYQSWMVERFFQKKLFKDKLLARGVESIRYPYRDFVHPGYNLDQNHKNDQLAKGTMFYIDSDDAADYIVRRGGGFPKEGVKETGTIFNKPADNRPIEEKIILNQANYNDSPLYIGQAHTYLCQAGIEPSDIWKILGNNELDGKTLVFSGLKYEDEKREVPLFAMNQIEQIAKIYIAGH